MTMDDGTVLLSNLDKVSAIKTKVKKKKKKTRSRNSFITRLLRMRYNHQTTEASTHSSAQKG